MDRAHPPLHPLGAGARRLDLGPRRARRDLAKVGPEFDGPFEADDPDAIDRQIHAGETDGIRDLVAKHASALGELAARLAGDEPPFTEIGFLDPRR